MGFSSGNEIFDPICKTVVALVEERRILRYDAKTILSIAIDALQNCDWDTEDESLDVFKQHDFVVDAFAENDVFVGDEDLRKLIEANEEEEPYDPNDPQNQG